MTPNGSCLASSSAWCVAKLGSVVAPNKLSCLFSELLHPQHRPGYLLSCLLPSAERMPAFLARSFKSSRSANAAHARLPAVTIQAISSMPQAFKHKPFGHHHSQSLPRRSGAWLFPAQKGLRWQAAPGIQGSETVLKIPSPLHESLILLCQGAAKGVLQAVQAYRRHVGALATNHMAVPSGGSGRRKPWGTRWTSASPGTCCTA